MLGVATLLGATATSIIGYLQAERVLRLSPPRCGAGYRRSSAGWRGPAPVLTWLLSTGVPLLAIVLSIVANKFLLLQAQRTVTSPPILLMAVAALLIGSFTTLSAMPIADPLRQLRWALRRGPAR